MPKYTKSRTLYCYARWSSAKQGAGDSERRQIDSEIESARAFALGNAMTLSEDVYKDEGVSAWHGDNRKSGKLASLLAQVREGDGSPRLQRCATASGR